MPTLEPGRPTPTLVHLTERARAYVRYVTAFRSVAGNCLRAIDGAIVDLAVAALWRVLSGRANCRPVHRPSGAAGGLPDGHPCVSLESHSSAKQLRSWTLTGRRDVGCGRRVAPASGSSDSVVPIRATGR